MGSIQQSEFSALILQWTNSTVLILVPIEARRRLVITLQLCVTYQPSHKCKGIGVSLYVLLEVSDCYAFHQWLTHSLLSMLSRTYTTMHE